MLSRWLIISAIAYSIFLISTGFIPGDGSVPIRSSVKDRVVISAPVQLIMYAGDRFLAANFETIRLAATTTAANDKDTANYLGRAHKLVSRLNPCHEDNYYLGNALLTWGGMEKESSIVLRRAGECRFWDEYPLFFYGFNQYFFYRNIEKASDAFNTAARRSSQNRAILRNLAIMIRAEQMDDEKMALNYLEKEFDKTDDPKLKRMLHKRLLRLQGLVTLREAQSRYEKRAQHKLEEPSKLVDEGILKQFPEDPLGLGYEFSDGKFHLRQRKVQGLEVNQ